MKLIKIINYVTNKNMSLKDLLKQVKKSEIRFDNKQEGGQEGVKNVAFASLTYDLNHRPLKKKDLSMILSPLMDYINKDIPLHTKEEKRLTLNYFRLALTQNKRARGCFHPSEISTEEVLCNRKLYFQKADIKEDATYVNFTSDNRMMRLVDLGTLMHLYIQENLDRQGVLKDYEVAVSFPEFGIEGKTDGVIEFVGMDDLQNYYNKEDMVLEIKTINEYGFKSLRKAKPEHVRQASLYGHLLGYKRICFLYYNKNTSEHKIYVHPVDAQYVEDFKVLAASIVKKYNLNVRTSRSKDVSLHDLPTRICQNRTIKRAMDCPFGDSCFSLKD